MKTFIKNNKDKLKSLNIGIKISIKLWLDEMKVTNYFINDDLHICVRDTVDLSNKNLIKLPDYIKFKRIKGSFYINNNELISLKGCPEYIGGNFWCQYNKLNNLEGCPKRIGSEFTVGIIF